MRLSVDENALPYHTAREPRWKLITVVLVTLMLLLVFSPLIFIIAVGVFGL